jgi:two-component system LytT family response regulator
VSDARVRALVVDDEPIARAGLRRLLGEFEWIAIAGEAASGPEAVERIETLKPDLVFLDIEMPGWSGVEALRRVAHAPLVVFTTAYAQHAVTAIELGALDYLLKPFGAERLRASLERVRAALGEPLPATLDRLGEAFGQGPLTRLFVRSGRAIVPLRVSDFDWLEAVGDYVAVHAGGAQHLVHVALNRLEERLDPKRFARLHRAHLVNLDRIVAFRRQTDGRVVAELRDGTKLAVSRARAQELRGLAK